MLKINEVSEKKQHIDFLDALRGIAVLLVVFVHTGIYMVHPLPGWLHILQGEGARGVQLFYILSALTLTISLTTNAYTGEFLQTIRYITRRFFRIAPLFYLLVISVGVTVYLFHPPQLAYVKMVPLNFISSLTFTNNFFPQYINNIIGGQWSIAIEVLFYVFFPLFFLRIKDFKEATRFYYVVLVLAATIEFVTPAIFPKVPMDIWKEYLFFSLPIQLPTFILGMVTYYAIFDKKNTVVWQDLLKIFLITFVVEGLFFAGKILTLQVVDLSILTPRIYLESVLFCGLIFLMSKGFLRFFNNILFRYIGKISYSIYLLHLLIFTFLTRNSI